MSRSKQVEVDPAPCACRQTVPLSVLALEVPAPIGKTMASWLADEVVTDELGRLAVPFEVARRVIAEHNAQQARMAEARKRPAPGPRRVPRGVPAMEGCSAYESMMIAAGERPGVHDGRVSPQQEWLASIQSARRS